MTELLYSNSNWLYSSAILLRVVVPVSRILYLSLRKTARICFVRCDEGLVISSDSSNTRHNFLEDSFTNRIRSRLSLPTIEVDNSRKIPLGTSSRSLYVRITLYRSLLMARNGVQVILVAMAGASITTLRTLPYLSRYLAL